MKNLFLFLFFIALSGGFYSQNKSDSLKFLIEQSDNWDEKAELTYEFCKLNLGSNPNECLELYNLIDDNVEKLTDSLNRYNLYNVKGILYQYRHDVNLSDDYLIMAIDLAKELGDSSLLCKSIGNIATNFRNEGDYRKAIDYTLISLKYNKNKNDTISWANNLTDIGNSYIYLKNYTVGLDYQQKALKLFRAKQYQRGIGNTCSSISYVFENNNKLDSAIFYSELALLAHEKSGNVYSAMSCKRAICSYNYQLNQSEQEKYECNSSILAMSLELNDRQGVMMDYLNISRSLNNMTRYEESIELKQKSLVIAQELNDRRVMAECYSSMSITYNSLKKYELAYFYITKANTISDSLTNINIQNAVLEADKKFQIAEKEKELLATKTKQTEAELKVSQKSKEMGFLGAGTIILLLTGGFLFYRTRQKQKSKLSSIRIEEQQKGLTAVIHAQEDERKRIAKDLHDGIVQQLVGVKLGLQKIFTGKESEETDKMLKMVHDSAHELREISHKMMPLALSELGLIPALDDMFDNSLGNTSIKYQFEHFGINSRFNERIEIAIFRICQELINNVIKHSNANNVNIQLFKTKKEVVLIVEDNGKGINPSTKKDGIGLMNISSRLDTINGKVNFEPSPESGTLATVKIPV